MNIAIVTYQDNGAYHQSTAQNEDDLLIDFLNAREFTAKKVIWNDPQTNWELFDLVIIKSPWDYFNLIDDFRHWIAQLEAKKIKVLNPLPIINWNANKRYLQDIAQAGLKVTPSIFLPKGSNVSLDVHFKKLDTDKIIIKPAVSGGSKNTFMVTKNDMGLVEEKLQALIAEEEFIIQPFLTEIEQQGEWSFVFFGGKFSHAVIKKAKEGDFRVQSAFGGSVHPQQPPVELLVGVQAYVDRFANNCLYARVDGTIVNGEFLLMELELIEPFLFLDVEPNSLTNYYEALTRFIKAN